MKALVKRDAREGIWLEDVPIPQIAQDEVLVKVHTSSICGTDVHIFNWDEWSQKNVPVPMTIGHEFSGTIEKIGSLVTGFKAGDRVSAEGHITCGYCRNCRAGRRHLCRHTRGIGVNHPGAFAEFVAVPASNIFPLPNDISFDLASIFDPLGNAVHTALSFPMVGEDVLITGAGPIGCMAAAICRHAGARHVVVTDVNEYRLNLARVLGCTRAVNVESESLIEVMGQLGMREGFDIGLEMSGSSEAIQQMFSLMNNGGKVALLGIVSRAPQIDWNEMIFKGLFIKGIYGREIFETWYLMASMIQSGLNVEGVITHRFPIDEYQAGFDVMRSGKSGKVLLEW
jgi:threonine 3-dehydrogenase